MLLNIGKLCYTREYLSLFREENDFSRPKMANGNTHTDIGEVFKSSLVLVVGQGLEPHDHDGDILGVPVEHALLVIPSSPGISAATKAIL